MYFNSETLIKIVKILGLVLHLLFLLIIIFYKSLRNRFMVFVVNLALIGLITLIYGLVIFDAKMVAHGQEPTTLCIFQGLYAHYCNYLSAFGVIALAFYRLACVTMHNLYRFLTNFKIILTLFIIWLSPILFVILPIYLVGIPIEYHKMTSHCRLNYTDHDGYFIVFIIVTNILPSILIGIIYVTIYWKLKTINLKKRHCRNLMRVFHVQIEPTTGTRLRQTLNNRLFIDKEKKLALQFILLYIGYESYTLSNMLLSINTSKGESNTHMSHTSISILRLFTWLHHIFNPFLYLLFHPRVHKRLNQWYNRFIFKFKIKK